jgi:hypothetical protein
MASPSTGSLLVVALLVSLAVSFAVAQPQTITPLTEYVYNPDLRHYRWNVSSIPLKGPGYTAYNVFLQSQVPIASSSATCRLTPHSPTCLYRRCITADSCTLLTLLLFPFCCVARSSNG